MSENAVLDTLFMPFDEGQVDWHAKTLFLYADWHVSLKPCDAFSVYKPAADRLTAQGFPVIHNLDHTRTYGLILAHIPKQVQEAQGIIAQAIDHLEDGGTLVLAADNDANGKRLQKWLEEAGFTDVTTESKNRARVVWSTKPKGLRSPEAWHTGYAVRAIDGYFTQPGLFSWDSTDRASKLLVDHLPADLTGHGADFGCGWGYLSAELLKKSTGGIQSLTLIDADFRAVTIADANAEGIRSDCVITHLWHDLTRPLSENVPVFNFIITNPPFHIGKKTDLDLGLSFIRTAWAQLKIGGTLYMVANAHLRYEEALGKLFKRVDLVIQKDGFKIIKAVK